MNLSQLFHFNPQRSLKSNFEQQLHFTDLLFSNGHGEGVAKYGTGSRAKLNLLTEAPKVPVVLLVVSKFNSVYLHLYL